MSRVASWSTTIVGLVLLTALCVRWHGPQMEADLATRTPAALGGEATDSVDVALDGRDMTFTDIVDSEDERASLGTIALGVRGVRVVDNPFRLAGEPDAADVAFSLADCADGLVVHGAVRDDDARESLLAEVEARFPGHGIRDELTVEAAPPAGWMPAVMSLLGRLGELPAGTLSGSSVAVEPSGEGRAVVLRGRVPSADAKAQAEALGAAGLRAPWPFRSELNVGDAAADAAGTQVESSAPGDADVEAAQQAPSVPRRFDGVAAEVHGHTDSKGGAASNLRLFKQHVDAVRRALSDAGVEQARLTVKGFGEDAPLATNDTSEGRARNRRVAFRLGAHKPPSPPTPSPRWAT